MQSARHRPALVAAMVGLVAVAAVVVVLVVRANDHGRTGPPSLTPQLVAQEAGVHT